MTTINLSTAPYYDDFDESKNYLKILFNPSYAVQARELTQLQTALQKQITRFGSHVFKDGSLVLNGNTSLTNVSWIDVTTSIDISSIVGSTIIGESLLTPPRGKVFKIVKQSNTVTRIYFSYISGTKFSKNETVNILGVDQFSIIDSDNFSGVASAFSIEDSVFYTKGHFVFCNSQSIILSDSVQVLNKKVGLLIQESIVTHYEDSTLLDLAETENYAAPGADRYSISLTLTAFDYNPQVESTTTGNFIELSRYVSDELVYKVTSATYSDLETTLARRTYDESGDYTVRAFGLKVKPHIFGDNANKLSLGIEPGKAYVKGYEFETIATMHVDLDKAKTSTAVRDRGVQVDFGSFIYINAPTGSFATGDYSTHQEIKLYKTGPTEIGTAVIYKIEQFASVFKLYLIDINITSGESIQTIASVGADLPSTFGATINTAAYGTSPVGLVNAFRKQHIIKIPNTPVKTLSPTYASYPTHNVYPVTFTHSGGTATATISCGSTQQFLGTDLYDFIVVKNSDGSIVPVTSISTPSSTSKSLSVTSGSSFDGKIYTTVFNSEKIHRTKSLSETTLTGVTVADVISLGIPDCHKLISVIARDTSGSPVASLDITKYFDIDSGQTDELYDYGSITKHSSYTINAAYDVLDITFAHFVPSTTSGYFSVDSYSNYDDIPTFTGSTGDVYNLRDCLDFRPYRQASTGLIIGGEYPVYKNQVSIDYEFYLSRIDKLVLTKERKFDLIKGIPSEYPNIPSDLYDAMTLYIVNVPAYTANSSDVTFSYIENRRYTMRDIGKIEKRVDRMEYFTSLSLLEKQAKDEVIYDNLGIERFKNGILVDSFAGHSVGDVNNIDYSCAIEPETRILRPRFSSHSFNYVLATLGGSNITQRGDLITLPYTSEILLEQPYATGTVNLNPFMIFNWNGLINIDPPSDTWIDVSTKPDVTVNMNGENDVYTSITDNVSNPASTGVRWNDWQTVNRGVTVVDNLSTSSAVSTSTSGGRVLESTNTVTTNNRTTTVNDVLNRTGIELSTSAVSTVIRDLGTKVVDVSIVPYIRSRIVKFAGKSLKPHTNIFATFDNVDVTPYCNSAVEIIFASGSVNSLSTEINSGSKSGKVILVKSDRVFIVMNDSSTLFAVDDMVTGNVGSGTYKIKQINYSNTLKTNEYGDVAGVFWIPNTEHVKFRTGEKTFRLSDVVGSGGSTAAEVKYIAQGLSQSVERTLVATRVATVSINPVQETQTRTSTTTANIVVSDTTTVHDVTPPPPIPQVLTCNDHTTGSLSKTFTLDFGDDIGDCGITYALNTAPIRYTIIWDGKEYTSGFVGTNSSFNNSELAKRGFPSISSAGSSSGLKFNKTTQYPSRAVLVIDSIFPDTVWDITVVCPVVGTPVQEAITLDIQAPATYVFTKETPANMLTSFDQVTVNFVVRSLSGSTNTWSKVSLALTQLEAAPSAAFPIGVSNIVPIGDYIVKNGSIGNVALNLPQAYVGHDYTVTINGTATEYSNEACTVLTGLTTTDSTQILVTTNWGNGAYDPVAQTFFVDSAKYPNGIFISGTTLFFKTKSTNIPVQVQVRPVVNGYPSSSVILPFGTSTNDASSVATSLDGSVGTYFEFDNICHLSPGEYAIVIVASTDEYEIFTSTLGEFVLTSSGLPGDTQRVTQQPTLGSMFKSQNASTWTPVQESDVKFIIHKCVFTTGLVGTATLNTDTKVNDASVNYDVFYTSGEVVDFAGTNIDCEFKSGSSWIPYQMGTNYDMASRTTLIGGTGSSLQFRVGLSTTDSNITPVVDLSRLSSVLIQNIINDSTSGLVGETSPTGGASYSRYITRRVTLNPGFESTDLKVYLSIKKPSTATVSVYYKVGTPQDTYFDDNEYVLMNSSLNGTYTETGFAEYKFYAPHTNVSGNTIAIASGDRFNIFSIKIVMTSSNPVQIPLCRDLRAIAFDD